MMNALRTMGRVALKTCKFLFWTSVVLLTLSGVFHLIASRAPAHMQSSTQVLKNGDTILHDGETGKTYLFPANTPSGTTVVAAEIQPRTQPKTVVFDLPGEPKEYSFDLPE